MVRVIHTDEAWMIARMVCRVLGLTIEEEQDPKQKRCLNAITTTKKGE